MPPTPMPQLAASEQEWFRAAKHGDMDVLRASAEKYARCRGENQNTALMFAVSGQKRESVEFLRELEKGMSNSRGDTAFELAVRMRYFDMAELLFDAEFSEERGDAWMVVQYMQSPAADYPKLERVRREYSPSLSDVLSGTYKIFQPSYARTTTRLALLLEDQKISDFTIKLTVPEGQLERMREAHFERESALEQEVGRLQSALAETKAAAVRRQKEQDNAVN